MRSDSREQGENSVGKKEAVLRVCRVNRARVALLIVLALVGMCVLGVASVSAQSPLVEEVNETYGGPDDDRANSMVETSDGGFAIGGETKSFAPGFRDAWLIKTDSNGDVEVNETFGGAANDFANSIIQTDDGGYALAGGVQSFGSGGDGWLIKTDANGDEEFNVTFGGDDFDRVDSVVQTQDGGYALAGRFSNTGIDDDAWLIKTDSNGSVEMNRTYGGASADFANSVVQTNDGGFAIGGTTESFGSGSRSAWLIKTDSNGSVEINQTYSGASLDTARSLVQTSGGGFAFGGRTASFGTGGGGAWLIKTNSTGNVEINKTFGGDDLDQALSVFQTSDDGFALGGETDSFGTGFSSDAWLIKTDSNGNEEFNSTFGGEFDESANSVFQTSDGGFAIGGKTISFGSGNRDAWLLKVRESIPDCEGLAYTEDSGDLLVGNVTELQCIGDSATTNGGITDSYRLTNDIDASETAQFIWNAGNGFDPVGNLSEPFNGTFDGAGNTVSNLTVNRSDENFGGLFGVVGTGGTVENVTLTNAEITSRSYFGPLVGKNLGTVTGSSASGVVTGNNMAGGLVGRNEGTVSRSSANTEVNADNNLVGGFVGRNLGTVTDSSASGDVSGNEKVGGFVGENNGGTVQRSFATGNVAGGGVGTTSLQPLQDASPEPGVGGFVGFNRGGSTVELSYAIGSVNSPTNSVGGFVGNNVGTVERSYAAGSVSGNDNVGGFAGENRGVVNRTYAVGNVDGSSNVGGLVGFNASFTSTGVRDSYWDVNTTGQSTSDGSPDSNGLVTDRMTGDDARGNMTTFDFNPTWVTTDTYPQLFWSVDFLRLSAPATLNISETAPAPSFFRIVDGRTPPVRGVADYSSNDTSVVTVSSPLTGVGPGTATVTAEHFGFSDSQRVKVTNREQEGPGEGEGADCIKRRRVSRGQGNEECPRDRTIERGGSREELDRNTGRNSDTRRRDRGRRSRSRGR